MKTKILCMVAALLACAASIQAQTVKTWSGGNGDFFDPLHWDLGTAPGGTDVALINNGSTATIAADAGPRGIGAIALGNVQDGTESGHVVMNGGVLTINGESGNPKAVLGLSTTLSTFIMNGGTILFDGPDRADLAGSTSGHGNNELDWEVGEKGKGRFEMHNDAVFRAADDLKVGANALGGGSVLIDGNARLSVGSGISVSEGGPSVEQLMIVAGNALVDSGNSMGAGNPLGHTDEGYLTMASAAGSTGRLIIQDNAVMNFRRLSARQGTSIITVKDHGQLHIFDVLNGKGFIDANTPPDRPAETGPNSTLSSVAPSDGTITLQDDAQMTVNSDPASGPTKGLGISGPRDAGNGGGTGRLIIHGRASFRVVQDLALGAGSDSETSDGTLEVWGPSASVSIGGNLNMAVDTDGNVVGVDPDSNPKPGKATLSAVISSATHTIVNVSGTARIANGRLKVTLDGYTPVTGNAFILIKGGTVDGQFAQTDFTAAPLGAGLSWEVEYKPDSVSVKVTGQPVGPRVVTVTTVNNVNPPAGQTSLLQALTGLLDGDVINFNIPGDGPHFIETPAGGYPVITKNNVTINGYSQPTSSPNTNPILAANNAKIKIVLDSRNGNSSLLDFAPTGPTDQTGYGDGESAVVGILTATNVTVRGVSILAVPLTGAGGDIAVYGVSFAKAASGHVNGCWIGVAPDGTTIAGPADAITGFRYRVRDENNTVLQDILINDVVVGVKAGSSEARSEFNVITGIPAIPIIIEGNGTRISGNFLNVAPDGVHDFNPPLVNPAFFSGTFEGNIEIGRGGNNTLIGTDGDGVNDADERNVFSGVVPPDQGGYDHNIEFYGQNPGTNVVVAGNYIGLGVDGVTRFTNGVPALNAAGGSARYRFGSDFDGVSDSAEANVIANNYPASLFPPSNWTPVSGTIAPDQLNFFDELSTGASVSARGNTFINNFPFPTSPLKSSGLFLHDYYVKALANADNGVVPVLASSPPANRLKGTVPVANPDYPTTLIDLYIPDPDGIANGIAATIPELPNGFVQGMTYLGSFVAGSAQDLDSTPGGFEFDLSGFDLKGAAKLTVTATYSKAAAGAHNPNAITSPFSDPAVAPVISTPLNIAEAKQEGNNLKLTLTGGKAPYTVQGKTELADADWVDITTTSEPTVSILMTGTHAFFRVVSRVTFPITLSGAAEHPAQVTSGTGSGTLILDGHKVTVDITYSGLNSIVTAGHIHGPINPATGNGNVLKGFFPELGTIGATSGTIKGVLIVDSVTVKHMLDGLTYVNIHTTTSPGGEIRGDAIPQ